MKAFAGGLWAAMGIFLLMAGCAPVLNTDCQVTKECQQDQVCSAGHCVSAGQIDGEVPTADGTTPGTDARPDSNMISPDVEDAMLAADVQQADARPTDATREDGDIVDSGKDAMHDGNINPPSDAMPPPGDATPDATQYDQGIPLDALPDAAPPPSDAIVLDPDAGNCQPGCIHQCTPSAEICEGLDNNCDGVIDEDFLGLGQPCFAGRGICQVEGINVCSPDSLSVVCSAEPGLPGEEICDGLDNDCDGDIDNGLEGQVEECGLGACTHSVTACDGGDLAFCDPLEGAMAEVCNGIDDDCDGAVDNGVLNACGGCGPVPIETCDGIDNNCDGQTDESGVCNPVDAGLPPDAAPPPVDAATDAIIDATPPADAQLTDAAADAAIDAGPTCVPSAELCDGQDNDCDGVIDDGVLNACGACGPVPVETCNDLDDDCNGVVDNDSNVVCHCADRPEMPYMQLCQGGVLQPCPCAETCNGIDDDSNGTIDDVAGLGQPCSQGVGACRVEGSQECDLVLGALTCSAQELLPSDEICDHLDNDCDGVIDNGVLNACDLCGPVPAEICDGADNDCDGAIDEGLLNACGRCGPIPTETCNGIDDDCNGVIDEGLQDLPCVTGEEGVCKPGRQSCQGANLTVCTRIRGPRVQELCEAAPSQDDNCSGRTNEGCSSCTIGVTTRSCYNGPQGTLGVGSCHAGVSTCVGNFDFGPCEAEVLPSPEIPGNGEDEDCDGNVAP